jgi:uncharacterized protein YvpB
VTEGLRARERPKLRRSPARGLVPLQLLGVLAIGALALGLVVGSWAEDGDPAKDAGVVRLEAGDRILGVASVERLRALGPTRRAAWLRRLPRTRRERRGLATVRFRTDAESLRRSFSRTLKVGGGTIELPERAVAAYVRLPIVKQALRNNCETAALAMLLVARRVQADQLDLLRRLARSKPIDPTVDTAGRTVWGDPQRGFVGRPEGGGTGGGYGVYERPIEALARDRGVELITLSGGPATTVYRRLLRGRPVMVWIGLSDGPYKTWVTPQGRRITGNFGEHTVVLTGVRGERVFVNDPLLGQRTSWTREQFELMWRRLGNRALSL